MLDIETDESKRIYGRRWYEFIADCRGMLGTESGASSFDLAGAVPAAANMLADGPLAPAAGAPVGEAIPYRTISPRHLEAAAFRVCQILFDGHYAGLLEPMVHYIPLRKDYSNLEEVLARFGDADLRAQLVENAHRDLIASGDLSYQRFVADVDADLAAAGLSEMSAHDLRAHGPRPIPVMAVRRAQTVQLAVRDATFPDRPVLDRALQVGRAAVRRIVRGTRGRSARG